MGGLTVLALGISLAIVSATAAEDKNDRDRGDNNKQVSDREFVQLASASGLAEVNLGNVARTRAASDGVRQFAQTLVQDHTQANQQLLQLANRKGWTLARSMDQKHQELERKLTGLSGAAFDREFVRSQIKDHEMAIDLFQSQAKNGKDKDLSNWAEKTLPHLKHHLEMARKLSDDKGKERTSGDRSNRSDSDR